MHDKVGTNHGGDGEVALLHHLRQPVHLPPRVAVDDRLRDGERLVEVAERVELPVLPLHRDVKLLDTWPGGRGEKGRRGGVSVRLTVG